MPLLMLLRFVLFPHHHTPHNPLPPVVELELSALAITLLPGDALPPHDGAPNPRVMKDECERVAETVLIFSDGAVSLAYVFDDVFTINLARTGTAALADSPGS